MTKHRVIVGIPGPSLKSETMASLCNCSRKHDFSILPVNRPVDNFNEWLCDVCNEFEAGNCTHAAMLHADVVADDYWLDVLLEEADARDAHVMSAVVPKKGTTGCCSCGVTHPDENLQVFRHITMREVFELPVTFDAGDFGYPDWTLLFNTGCMVIDLRDGRFLKTNADGSFVCWFNFPREYGRMPNGRFGFRRGRSEDYWFAAQAQQALGARCFCTRAVGLWHGMPCFTNKSPWGEWEHGDEQNAYKWRNLVAAESP